MPEQPKWEYVQPPPPLSPAVLAKTSTGAAPEISQGIRRPAPTPVTAGKAPEHSAAGHQDQPRQQPGNPGGGVAPELAGSRQHPAVDRQDNPDPSGTLPNLDNVDRIER